MYYIIFCHLILLGTLQWLFIASAGHGLTHPSYPKSLSRNSQPKNLKGVDFALCQLSTNTVDPCLCECARTCVAATYVCVYQCVLTQGQREYYTCSVGARVHVKTLEQSFSGALSYAQASFLGHMMSSSSVREDVVSCSNECVYKGGVFACVNTVFCGVQ